MKKTKIILLTTVITALSSCNNPKNEKMTASEDNPLLAEWQTPFEVPPFDLIQTHHYKPAIEDAIKEQQKEINAIIENKEQPTFENVIVALENTGKSLNKITSVFYNLSSTDTNKEMQDLAQQLAPIISENSDNIYLNAKLFEKVNAVYQSHKNNKGNLSTEDITLLEKTYKNFIRKGANLSNEDKEKLRKINSELAVAALKFGDNLLSETQGFKLVVENKEELAGLPNELITAAEEEANNQKVKNKWIFTLDNASVMPFLQYATNRNLREKIWNAYQNRGNNNNGSDNKEIIANITNLNLEKALLLGYKNYAAYVLEESMAKSPEEVNNLLDKLWTPAIAKAKEEAADIKKMMEKDGIKDDVKPYDWRYYAEKIRKERFDLDEQAMKPFFSIDQVRDGIFKVTEKLWGLSYTQIKDIPTYHESVTAWEVKEKNGETIGILYMDMHPRPSKRGGAWMTSFRDQSMENGKRKIPIISIVCNFSKPTNNAPALLTFDEVSTFFHEFGHALHGLLSNVKYTSLAGTNVPRDFVELPSQIMENWAAEPEVLKLFAKHYKTQEIIPDTLIEKMKAAGTFDQGFATTEYLAASLLDMGYHTIETPLKESINDFEKRQMQQIGLIDAIIPRYRSTYFSHIFGGGYSAGYYSYIWSEILDSDAFEAFKETSLFDKTQAEKFRKNILEKGGTEQPDVLYRKFRGRDPKIEPLLKKRGLIQ